MKTKIFRAGQCYRENRMLPVLTKALRNGPTLNTQDIARNVVKGEDMYCLLVQPSGNHAIFIDVKGTEYLVSIEELNQTLNYRNSLFQKRVIPLYTVRRGIGDKFVDVAKTALERPDIIRKYKGWVCQGGIFGECTEVTESVGFYKVGGLYKADDWSFIVTSVSSASICIIDLADEKEYTVSLSDSKLANAKFIEIIKEFEGGLDNE